MFGHNDDQQQANPDPAPDATLTHTDGADAPAVTPVDDTAGEFIASEPTVVTPPAHDLPAVDGDNATPAAAPAVSDDLLSIKQQALQELSPLVGHLDQSPEEKFRTTMMMIQASDNSALVQAAYEAAKLIPDEKARAQALLDIVNEINYFTQHNQQ